MSFVSYPHLILLISGQTFEIIVAVNFFLRFIAADPVRALFRCEMAMVVLPRVASGRVTACSLSVTTHLRVDDISSSSFTFRPAHHFVLELTQKNIIR